MNIKALYMQSLYINQTFIYNHVKSLYMQSLYIDQAFIYETVYRYKGFIYVQPWKYIKSIKLNDLIKFNGNSSIPILK